MSDKTLCFVFYGPGGSGKSSFAFNLASFLAGSYERVYCLPSAKSSGTYWTGYSSGDVVVIDEMKGDRFTPTFFNKLIDGGPMFVPGYGCEMVFNSRYVIVTTNVTPKLWWPNVSYMHSLQRRLLCFPVFRRLNVIHKTRKLNGISILMAPVPAVALTSSQYGFPQ